MSKPRRELDHRDVAPTLGHAEAAEDSANDWERYAAVLWVPDIEQRHGWREVYIRRESKPGARRMGFRR